MDKLLPVHMLYTTLQTLQVSSIISLRYESYMKAIKLNIIVKDTGCTVSLGSVAMQLTLL